MRFIKKIVERGNVTIPSDVREALDIDEGDIVEFDIVNIVKKTEREAAEEAAEDEPTRSDDRSSAPSSSPRPNSTAIQSSRGSTQ